MWLIKFIIKHWVYHVRNIKWLFHRGQMRVNQLLQDHIGMKQHPPGERDLWPWHRLQSKLPSATFSTSSSEWKPWQEACIHLKRARVCIYYSTPGQSLYSLKSCWFRHNHRCVRRWPVTLTTLQDDLFFAVVQQTDGAGRHACTGGTLGVIILPLTPHTWSCGTTLRAGHAPTCKRKTFNKDTRKLSEGKTYVKLTKQVIKLNCSVLCSHWHTKNGTICTSSCRWVRSAAVAPSSTCGSWCRSRHTVGGGQGHWPDHTPRTPYTPNTASLYSEPPLWSTTHTHDERTGSFNGQVKTQDLLM